MLAGQAISNNVMDFLGTTGSNAKSNTDSSTSNLKDAVSFDKLLSRSAIQDKFKKQDSSSKSSSSDISAQKLSKQASTANQKTAKVNDAANKLMSSKAAGNQIATKNSTTKTNAQSSSQKVASAVSDAKQEVMKSLDMTEEQLENVMQMLGLGMMDLLDPNALKMLVLDQAGVNDPSMLLTEDGLGQQLHELLSNINDLMNQANVTMDDISKVAKEPEEFNHLMNLLNQSEEIGSNTKTDNSDELNGNKELNGPKENDEASKIQFTVVKEDGGSKETSDSKMTSDSNGRDSQSNYKTESTMTNQFLDQMVNATADLGEATFSENLREIHDLREITTQIVDHIKLTIKPEQTSMDFHLNPEHLGKVALNISSKNGILTASFTTQNEVAKEAIESQMQVLKDNLSSQGIKVEAIEVTVSDFTFRQESSMSQESSQQQNSSSQSKRAFRMNAGEDVVTTQQEETEEQTTVDSGSNIDYSA